MFSLRLYYQKKHSFATIINDRGKGIIDTKVLIQSFSLTVFADYNIHSSS